MQPSYNSVNCTLKPDPAISGGVLNNQADNCKNDLSYFNTTTKKWNCPWDVNSLP